jgi:predicted permease
VRQLLIESLVLATAGSAAGLALAAVLVRVMLPLVPDAMLAGRPVRVDAPVFVFTAGTALAIALLFGAAPAREALRRTRRRPMELRSMLVAAEVALSLVLLVAATLMARSFSALTAVDPGFRPDHALTLAVTLPAAAYRDQARQFQYFSRSLDALAALPGVRAVTLVSALPFSGSSGGFALASAEGEPPWSSDEGLRHRVEPLFISTDYFRAMGTPLVEGREFSAAEMVSGRVVIINQALARRYFGAGRATGRRIKLGFVESSEPFLTIVGVARDSRRGALEDDGAPTVYRPYLQRNGLRSAGWIVRTAGDPAALAEPARRTLASLDRAVATSGVQTLEQRLNRSMASQKLRSISAVLLALLALAMVVTGLYGVLSYLVSQRTVELGVRIALGAAPADIFTLVLRRGLALALAGIGAGMLLSLATTQSLQGLLFGVAPGNPWVLAGASALMLAVSAAASAVPAWRATHTDPIRCLRQE